MNREDIRILKVMLLLLFAFLSAILFAIGIPVIQWFQRIDRTFAYPPFLVLGFIQAFLYWRLGRQFSRIDREAKDW